MIEPETQDAIFDRIRDAIASASAITNFSPNSPERAITDDGFAAEQRERQHEELAVQLSSYIDYAGKGTDNSEVPINANDLDDLEVADPEAVDLDLLNSYIERNDLDQLVKRYSIFRDPGAFATGTVTFQTASEEVVIPDGTSVGTQPDADGDFLEFVTTKEVVSSQGSTSVDAPIQATERGTRYNVGSGTITYLPESVP
ncbi:MAG: baseplate J/gp47 family protein, partial [Halobacteria archaeon]|nr:baseplate J/gp47 family protein [Halobacteria archaeon]